MTCIGSENKRPSWGLNPVYLTLKPKIAKSICKRLAVVSIRSKGGGKRSFQDYGVSYVMERRMKTTASGLAGTGASQQAVLLG